MYTKISPKTEGSLTKGWSELFEKNKNKKNPETDKMIERNKPTDKQESRVWRGERLDGAALQQIHS